MHLFRAPMAERAMIILTILFVSAWKATPETIAKRVIVSFLSIFGVSG